VLAGSVVPAGAALTTPACLGLKLKAWGTLGKCQRTEDAKGSRARIVGALCALPPPVSRTANKRPCVDTW